MALRCVSVFVSSFFSFSFDCFFYFFFLLFGWFRAYVHDAAVDVAELLEAEQPRAVSRVIESKALSFR